MGRFALCTARGSFRFVQIISNNSFYTLNQGIILMAFCSLEVKLVRNKVDDLTATKTRYKLKESHTLWQ
jgi:hypothetical protein